MEDFEVHPRGTGEVLRQLRAEREALEVRCEEQRVILDRARQDINWMLNSRQFLNAHVFDYLHKHLEGTQ